MAHVSSEREVAQPSGSRATARRAATAWVWAYPALAIVGAVALALPISQAPGRALTWLEAAFLAVSGATGTGLSPRDPAAHLSGFGAAVLAVLLGAGALIALAVGIKVALALRQDEAPIAERHAGVTRRAIGLVIVIQVLGALALLPIWSGVGTAERIGLSLFQSIDAFSNGGFALMPGGWRSLRHGVFMQTIIAPIALAGALGWAAWAVLSRRSAASAEGKRAAMSCLTALAAVYLIGTLCLVAARTAPHFYEQLQLGTTSNMPLAGPLTRDRLGASLADASYLAAAGRAHGADPAATAESSPAAAVALMALMLVGGLPGGTAGGLSIIAVVALLATLRPSAYPFWRRLLPPASAVAVSLFSIIAGATFLLSVFEPYPFLRIAFEATSAATGSGLSLGITGGLTAFGKSVIIAAMLLGKAVPLALWLRFVSTEALR